VLGWKYMYEQAGKNGMGIGSAVLDSNRPHTFEHLISIEEQPNIWHDLDNFARSFYSFVLADLGQNSSQNILLNAAALQHFTKNFSSMTNLETPWLKAGPARSAFEGTEPLRINASHIYTNYLCQIPRLKSTGALFVAVLVADLVFLQVAWKLLNFITTIMVDRRDPQAHFSRGCLMCAGAHGPVELGPLKTSDEYQAVNKADNNATAISPRSSRHSGSRLLTAHRSSESQIPILVSAEPMARPRQDRTLGSEGITTGVDHGTEGGYQRI
jgi:hypothetical protein